MIKGKKISVYSDLKTGLFSKLFLILGFFLIIFYFLQKTIGLIDVDVNIIESILAFSIIFIGVGIISFLISYQFSKLAKIADEIEKENLMDED